MSRKFTKWTQAVLFLNQKINSRKMLAGNNITLENTGSGIRIHGNAGGSPGGGASDYNGYFKVVKVDNKFGVVDGSNPQAEYCGCITVNNNTRTVKKCFWELANLANGEWTVFIQAYESFYWQHSPSYCSTSSYQESSMRRRLATVTKDGDKITIKQIYEGGGINFAVNWYAGPFAISDTSVAGGAKSVKVKAGSVKVGYSYVSTTEISLNISEATRIYIELKWTGSEYVAAIKTAASIPIEPAGQMHILIGEVYLVNDGIGFYQSLRDNYTVTGRIV